MSYSIISIFLLQISLLSIFYLILYFGFFRTFYSDLNEDLYQNRKNNKEGPKSNYYYPKGKYLKKSGYLKKTVIKHISLNDYLFKISFNEGRYTTSYSDLTYQDFDIYLGRFYSANIFEFEEYDLKRQSRLIFDLYYYDKCERDDEPKDKLFFEKLNSQEFNYKCKIRKNIKIERGRVLIKRQIVKSFKKNCSRYLLKLKLFKLFRFYYPISLVKNKLILSEKLININLSNKYKNKSCYLSQVEKKILNYYKDY